MSKTKIKTHKIYLFLSSARLAIVLTILILLFLLSGLLIPQRGFMSPVEFEEWRKKSPSITGFLESTGLLNVYSHPVLIGLFILLLLNVFLCTVKRLRAIKERVAIKDTPAIDNFSLRREIFFPQDTNIIQVLDNSPITNELRKRGFRIYKWQNSFRAVKNRTSLYGSIVFHISFLIMLLGAIISMWTRFTGIIILAEGQPFKGNTKEFYSIPGQMQGGVLFPRFVLEKISPSFNDEGKLMGLNSKVRMLDSGEILNIGVNRPVKAGGFEIHIRNFGYTPLWILKDSRGSELDGAFVNLVVGGERVDSFRIPQGGYEVYVKFYPDFVEENGKPGTRSWYPKNPYFYITVKKGEERKFEGLLPLGKNALFDGLSLEFREVRYWGQFVIIRDEGKGIIFLSFIFSITGVAWRLLFYRREIAGIVKRTNDGSLLVMLGSSDLYSGLFYEEFESIVNLAERMGQIN